MNDSRFDFTSFAFTLGRIAFSLAFAASSVAAHADSSWITDNNGCKHFNPRPAIRPGESVTWTGACIDGYAEGNGVQQWFVNGEMTENCTVEKKHGMRSGKAACKWTDGNSYEGTYVEGKRSGHGIFRWANGNTYEGDFVDDKRTGHGTFHWSNGDTYEGDFVGDKRAGHGVSHWVNGSGYEGDFADDLRTGRGTYHWSNGNAYEGEFLNNQQTGHGVVTTTRGDRFEGDYYNGQLFGHAVLQWADGQHYEGNIDNGVITPAGLNAAMVCTKMGVPHAPAMNWHGSAIFKATATVHDGHVTDVTVASMTELDNPAIQKTFVEMIASTLKAYECPGNHVFQQEFRFRLE